MIGFLSRFAADAPRPPAIADPDRVFLSAGRNKLPGIRGEGQPTSNVRQTTAPLKWTAPDSGSGSCKVAGHGEHRIR
jgi:hypothetical protein